MKYTDIQDFFDKNADKAIYTNLLTKTGAWFFSSEDMKEREISRNGIFEECLVFWYRTENGKGGILVRFGTIIAEFETCEAYGFKGIGFSYLNENPNATKTDRARVNAFVNFTK